MPLPPDADGGHLVDCAYSRTGDRMATASSSGAVRIYACGSGGAAAATDPAACAPTLLHVDRIAGAEPTALAWAPDELGSAAAVGTSRGGVHVIRTGTDCGWQRGGELACGRGRVRALAFAPAQQGLVLAAASDDGSVYVHEGSLVTDGSSSGSSSGSGGGVLAWTLLSKIEASEDGPCSCLAWRPFTAGVPPLLLAGSAEGAKAWCYQHASWRVRRRMRSFGLWSSSGVGVFEAASLLCAFRTLSRPHPIRTLSLHVHHTPPSNTHTILCYPIK